MALQAFPTVPAAQLTLSATQVSATSQPAPAALWLCCYLPRLPLEVFKLEDDYPAAVWVDSGGRSLISAATPAAGAFGIHPGLPTNAALALCAGLQLHRRDERMEREALEKLAEAGLGFTPWVSLDYPAALVLEIRGSLTLFGGLNALTQRLRAKLENLGHCNILAAAPAPFPAWLIASSGLERTVENPAALRSGLGDLAIARLPLERNTANRLAKAGLHTLRDLWRLPRDGLARRYGLAVLRQLDRAAGREKEMPGLFRTPPVFQAYRELAAETENLAHLRPVCAVLLENLAAFLRQHDAATDRLELELFHFRRPATRLELKLRYASRDPERISMLLSERLERTPLPDAVTALRLRCGALQPYRAHEADLFAAKTPGVLDWETLLEQLQQRLGRDALRFLDTPADHRPELAWKGVSGAPEDAVCDWKGGFGAPGDAVCDWKGGFGAPGDAVCDWTRNESPIGFAIGKERRPLWLLPKPRPCDPTRYRLLPERERIESGWWDGASIRRDYRVAVSPEGVRAWIYRELDGNGGWYLHGFFA
ncbi:DNA polymerase Y family protein [Methylocaldum sp. RMAD-M]|jgi:protein ImuB|uniref:Y-family DNA polymerase n=1 Tax=Methylocaldum sp. RMAD-M TaxID=2806557 RepID=UPI000A323258|nr:DNA polymerase Y family protein [Methylocaldum sp. RMAD-M]MBP1148790.1 protein ImuB [Methylocaldum sp. RMAD-M]